MPFYIAVYDWSLFTLPDTLTDTDIKSATHANDPAASAYDADSPSWIGETYTYNGGSSTKLEIDDDDSNFEDAYVETGGAQTLTQAATINGTTYPAGSTIENEFSMLDASGNEVFVVRVAGENIGFAYAAEQEPTDGATFTPTAGRDGTAADSSDGVSSSTEPYAGIVCYAKGTLILTPNGEVAVETLGVGDYVTTPDHDQPRPIRWVRSAAHALEDTSPDDKPVLIKAGALGPRTPTRDLIVSSQHRILVGATRQLRGVFDREYFVPAKALTGLRGVRHMNGKKNVTWVHFACDAHEVVSAQGCLSESLLLGRMVLNGLTFGERRALTQIYGKVTSPDLALNGPAARPCLSVAVVQRTITRYRQQRRKIALDSPETWGCYPALAGNDAASDAMANDNARDERTWPDQVPDPSTSRVA